MASNQVPRKTLKNPYVHRRAIKDSDYFFGRAQETRELLDLTAEGQSVSIVGPRRIGKTSLLFHLRRSVPAVEADTETKHIFVFLDCQRKYRASQLDICQWM